MQFFALEKGKPVSALKAEKQRDYQCPECSQNVRLRSGPHRQPHFYHSHAKGQCRQHQKSLEHLQAQHRLYQLFPEGECTMERPFPAIGRIADVVWETQKIVFEIQCSPIPREEAEARCRDYRSLGLQIVWILHEKNFNRRRLSAAESLLREETCCYFTDITASGRGQIYDQFDLCKGSRRLFKGPPLTICMTHPSPIEKRENGAPLPQPLRVRLERWGFFFRGDLWDRWNCDKERRQAAERMERMQEHFLSQKKGPPFSLLTPLKQLYRCLLLYLLKRLS